MIRRFAIVAILCMTASAALLAQTRPLNPTVKVLERASGALPADCEEGLTPQPAPRVQVTEIPREPDVRADMQPPPSRDLRDTLRNAQSSAETNNREAFRTSLVASREIAATYPPGGERTAANETIAVLNDNNFPSSSGRTPGKPDNNEFITIRLAENLHADPRVLRRR